MCGIAGAIGSLAKAARSESSRLMVGCVARMSRAIRHRGPDGDGLWESPTSDVVLAHRRLAIIDLSEAGAQPMVDERTGCVIVFNGEVYNFRSLRTELEGLGEHFRSTSDTEVILKAYARWGIDMVPRLRGIFALGIWDPRSRTFHLARDQLGVKPLYWTVQRNGPLGREVLLFASEVRALMSCGVMGRKLNPDAVASFLAHGFVIGPGTILDGVELLPSGSILTVSPGGGESGENVYSHRYYWNPPPGEGARISFEEFREELANTVRLQLVSDAPLGIFLSGGIDSSAVAALASQVQPEAIHTFTIGFEEPGFDESRFAAAVARAIRSHHTDVTLRERDFLDQLPDALASIDQPTFDAINTYFVSRAARSAGMTVALAGTGGDELFGGYASFTDLPRMLDVVSKLPGTMLDGLIGAGASVAGSLAWGLLRRAPSQARLGKLADILRAHDLIGAYQTFYALFTRDTQARLATGPVRLAQKQQILGLPAEVAERWRLRVKDSPLLHAISMLELFSFLGERLLRDTDAASMAVALEVRVPLLDHVLWEKVSGVAEGRRFLPMRRKQLLRDAALSRLDATLFERPKSGFVLPIAEWSRRALRSEMESLLTDSALVRRAGLEPETVRVTWKSYLAGKSGLHWSRVWSLYVLVAWCRDHDMVLEA
jgi:asparagine synthase (glutamine-hydrolysing)